MNQSTTHHQQQSGIDQSSPNEQLPGPKWQRCVQAFGTVCIARMDYEVVHFNKSLKIEWGRVGSHQDRQGTDTRF